MNARLWAIGGESTQMSSLAYTVREDLVRQLDDFSVCLQKVRDELLQRANARPEEPGLEKIAAERESTTGLEDLPSR